MGYIIDIDFSWTSFKGVQNVIDAINALVNIIRFVVPIILLIMIVIDIVNKTINPTKSGDGGNAVQEKILRRLIAAILIFFLPTVINLTFNILGIQKVDKDGNPTDTTNYNIDHGESTVRYNTDTSLAEVDTQISINGCNSGKKAKNGDSIKLIVSNYPEWYSSGFKWEITNNMQNSTSVAMFEGNKTSIESQKSRVEIYFSNIPLDVPAGSKVTIKVKAGVQEASCDIYYE